MLLRRVAGAAFAAGIVLLCSAGGAGAVTWKPVFTGTNEPIVAIDYHSPTQLWFATRGGKIFARQPDGSVVLLASFPARRLFDLAIRPSGDVALVAADNGQLLRFAGGVWTTVSLANASLEHFCNKKVPPIPRSTPTANLLSVAWSSDNVAWATTEDAGQILKSVDAGATWNDVGRLPDGSCRIDGRVTDVAPVAGSATDVYFVGPLSGLRRTTDGLATDPPEQGLMGECSFDTLVRLAVDPGRGDRVSGAGACYSGWAVSDGTSSARLSEFFMSDVAAVPGELIAVGDSDRIEQSFGGSGSQHIPAGGPLWLQSWTAVDLLDQQHGAIGSYSGALALSNDLGPRPKLYLRWYDTVIARHRHHGVMVRVYAHALLPAGMTEAQACQGKVRITVRHVRRRLGSRFTRLDPKCDFGIRFTLKGRTAARARRLNVSAFFLGNPQMGAAGASQRVRVRR